MIRFLCPTCQKHLKAPDEGAGRKTHCPRCGQRLLVPPPIQVRNKTVLGQTAAPPTVLDCLEEIPDPSTDPQEADPVVSMRETWSTQWDFRRLFHGFGFATCGAVGFILLLVGVGVCVALINGTNLHQLGLGRSNPKTVKELVALLNARGMQLDSDLFPQSYWIKNYPTHFVQDRRYESARQKAAAKWGPLSTGKDGWDGLKEWFAHTDELTQGEGFIAVCPTPEEATKAALAGKFDNAFSWGCFVIDCNPGLSEEIKGKLR